MPGGGFTFSQVPLADIPRSVFNRSHGHKTTFDAGKLIPFYVDEALPGDTFQVDVSAFARFATPIFPLMDNMHMDFFFFAVPNRLVWENWQKFCGEQENPGDSIDFVVPQVVPGIGLGFDRGSIFDYMGIPCEVADLRVNALHARAYNLIWNEWFRDENLQDRVEFAKDNGPDDPGIYSLLNRGKRHDYFTSCLPWPQKGVAVEIPLGSSAPLTANIASTGNEFTVRVNGVTSGLQVAAGQTGVDFGGGAPGAPGPWGISFVNPQLEVTGIADLSSATAATINSLRQAFQIQKMMERDARGGTRYTEILRSHFGVVSPDARLQRPEYLGGGSIPIIVNPVVQNSETTVNSPQGNLAAYGVAAGSNIGFSKSFVEHCVLIGLVSVRGDVSYQQGLPRMFSRRTRYDYYWPAMAHIGEQAVLNKEIFAQGPGVVNANVPPTPVDDDVFGYQERWAEYRYFPSKVTGKFRSDDPQPLDAWHLAQDFAALPVLDSTFIQENPPVDRVIAVPSEPHFLFDSHIEIACTRPMPTYSIPGMLDHF